MAVTVQRGISFIVGVGLSLLPAFAPFAALLYFLVARWRLDRLDQLACLAVALLGLPLLANGQPGEALLTGAQLVAAWLLYRSFQQLAQIRKPLVNTRLVGLGLLTGLALAVGIGLLQIQSINVSARLSQVIVWENSPALFAHTTLALGTLIAILVPSQRVRMASLALSACAILISGSREAAVAWVLITLALLLLAPARSLRRRFAEWGVFAAMMMVAAGAGPALGWGNLGFLVDLAPSVEEGNLLRGTEVGAGDWWLEQGVSYATGTVSIGGSSYTSYRVTKRSPEEWRRLQQLVAVEPLRSYTVSAFIRPEGEDLRPGVQGWGELLAGGTLTISGVLADGEWRVRVTGPGRLIDSGTERYEDGWTRVWLSFEHHAGDDLYLWLGLAPDQRNVPGASTSFAGFQLERGVAPGAYVPGPANSGLGLRTARIPYWQAALAAATQRPTLGWGTGTFDDYYRGAWQNRSRFETVPQHTHNLFLQVLFERGLVGLMGLAAFLTALFWSAVRRRDLQLIIVLIGILIANLFDYTLFYGGVLYPLAAAIGWRSGAHARSEPRDDQIGRQFIVRFTLAVGDFMGVVAALFLSSYLAHAMSLLTGMEIDTPRWHEMPTPVFYALLLWPILAWKEGLYPSYGQTAPQELRKQFMVTTTAGLLLAASTFLLNEALPLPRSLLVLTVVICYVSLPIVRSLLKRGLNAMRLWGQPVVIMGAGVAGRRVARALKDFPLDGLTPVAFFDDDPSKIGGIIEGVPVAGDLSQVGAWSSEHNVQRAIVAISRANTETVARILRTRGDALERLQFVPDLPGLPVLGVQTGSLDGMLALEVRNELSLPHNRIVKRVVDVLLVLIGAVIFAPLIGLLALLIRLDSPGPIFFAHRRLGRAGKTFRTFKFRTMVRDSDEVLMRHLATDPDALREWQERQKLQRDPRVTRVGRFLRRTSLDELPQLFNVLRGEMSLVGPRPIVEAEIDKYEDVFELYKMVRPGITGYWQVSGRSGTDYRRRVELDSFYVRNWSIWLDIVILVRTVRVVLRGEGAW